MLSRVFPFLALLLVACVSGDSASQETLSSVASSSQTSSEAPLEQLPSAWTIEHFANMRLSGTGLTLDSVESKNSVYTRHRISYFSNGLRITGILNIPLGDGPFPLLIFNHGYIEPSIYTQGRGLKREQDYMARQGFAVLHTDYRGHAGSDKSPMPEDDDRYDGNLEYAMDSVNAINAVRAANLPSIDATKVGMLGHSMGGGVTLAILTAYPELVSAAVLYAPVHADVWENFVRWRRERPEGDRTIEVMKTRDENPASWDALSPQTYLSAIQTPIMLFQGDKDKDVPAEWSDTLADNLRAAGKELTYVEYPNEGHEFATQWGDFMKQSAAFFQTQLADQ
ncbi:alpha/beta fold hydrolase [Candidatus Peribacteria bacterium]|nr:MAG: alpha/beta fold hydrolase [Candidatus Peribacteria bacterium]